MKKNSKMLVIITRRCFSSANFSSGWTGRSQLRKKEGTTLFIMSTGNINCLKTYLSAFLSTYVPQICMEKINLQAMASVVSILPFINFSSDKQHNDEAKASVWKAQSGFCKVFGVNKLMKAFAIDSPKPGLALRCVLLCLSRRLYSVWFIPLQRVTVFPLIGRILRDYFSSAKVLFSLLQSWWDFELVQNSLAAFTQITFLHWEGFVSNPFVLCPETKRGWLEEDWSSGS